MNHRVDGSEIRRAPPGMVLKPYEYWILGYLRLKPSTVPLGVAAINNDHQDYTLED